MSMAAACVFSCRRRNLPSASELRQDPFQALDAVLEELNGFVQQAGQAHVTWDLADNNLTLAHVQHIADWLSQRKRHVRLHALDLCFNRVLVTDWKTFLPLVKQLSDSVTFMEFGGNYLPAILQADAELHHAVFETVCLAPPSSCLTGDDWVDTWSQRARTFRLEAYGFSFEM